MDFQAGYFPLNLSLMTFSITGMFQTTLNRQSMLTWVERYNKASVEAKHMIIATLVDRFEIGENYEVHIQFKVSAEQFIRQTA